MFKITFLVICLVAHQTCAYNSGYGYGDSQQLEQTLEGSSGSYEGSSGPTTQSSGGSSYGGSSMELGSAKGAAKGGASSYGSGQSKSPSYGKAEEAHPAPEPYQFSYETMDEYGTKLTRSETGDANGNVMGSYMFRDKDGLYRTVKYGDHGDGFQAMVQTNEPGVVSHKPADAEYIKKEGGGGGGGGGDGGSGMAMY